MLVAREEVTIRERGSPPWAFALAQVRIRSADGQSQSASMDCYAGGQRWPKWVTRHWCPVKRPGAGVEETPVQLQCVVGNGGLVLVAKSPRIGKCGPRKA